MITHEISYIFDVNGAAIEASASDNEMPTSAAFNAPQSLAPSPHIPHNDFLLIVCSNYINNAFYSGFILAKIYALSNILPNTFLAFGLESTYLCNKSNALPEIAITNGSSVFQGS